MAFKFKSSGVKIDSPQIANIQIEKSPIGIKTPMTLGDSRSGIFAMSFDLGEQIADNFRNLLLTNRGERIGRSDFGANLRPLVSELSAGPDFESQVSSRISAATQQYMPYISLESFSTSFSTTNLNGMTRADVKVIYSVPTLGISSKSVTVSIYVVG